MILIKIRRGIVYAATSLFFAVAAIGLVQGDDTVTVFLKAGIACLVPIIFGRMILRLVDDAASKAIEAKATAKGASTKGGESGARAAATSAEAGRAA